MEDDGEGMVAIVQALRNAELAVTVLDGRLSHCDRPASESTPSPAADMRSLMFTPHCRSSTAAQTVERDREMCRLNHHGEQGQDDRFASNYQISHCRVLPTSPPERISEFPHQKTSFCPYQGNFEVGGHRYGEVYHPVRDDPAFKSSLVWPDRANATDMRATGAPCYPAASISRGTDAFAESLRKYPNRSPERATSAEMIQRLLCSTQAKYLNKSSYHTRSLRSLIRRSQDPARDIYGAYNCRKLSKNIQTKARQDSPTRDVNTNTNVDAGSSHRPGCNEALERKYRNLSPRDDRNVKLNDKQIDTTYDYLKSASRRITASRDTEVHYLDDLSRCVRETLRHLYEDQTVVCPRIASRYNQHRKECAGSLKRQRSAESVHTEVPTLLSSRTSRDVSCLARYGSTSPTSTSLQSNPPTCSYCQKPLPCSCGHSCSFIKKIRFDYPKCFPSPPTCKFNLYKNDEEPCPCPSEEIEKKVDDLVFNWLNSIPVNADYCPEDKAMREQMAENLADALKQWIDDPSLSDMAKVEAIKCLTYMPMWYPDRIDPMTFRNQLADNLVEKLLELNKSRFEEEISKWVDGLNFKVGKGIIKELVKRLKPIALDRPFNDDEYKDALKYATRAILQDLPLDSRNDRMNSKEFNQIADKLAEKLVALPPTIFGEEVTKKLNLQEAFIKGLKDTLSEVPELAGAFQKSENQHLVQKVANKLADLQKQGPSSKELKDTMKKETKTLVDTIIGNEGVTLNPKAKAKLTENLLNIFTDTAKKCQQLDEQIKKEKAKILKNKFKQNITDLLQEIPELADALRKKRNQEKVEKLAKKISELQPQGLDENEIREEIKKETKKLLDSVLESESVSLGPREKAKLTENLLNKVTDTARAFEKSEDFDSLQNNFEQNIKDLLVNVPELADTFVKKENQQQIEKLAKKLAELQAQGLGEDEIREEMKKEIKKLLENEGASLNPKAKAKLTENLLDQITETAKQAEEAKGTKSLQKEFKKDLKSLFEGVPELVDAFDNKENQLQVEKLAKKLAELLEPGLDEDEMKEVLKRETNKLLDSVLENEGASLSPKVKAKLTENLLDKLIETAKQAEEAKCTKSLQNEFKKDIKSLLEVVPELADAFDKKDNLQQVEKFGTKLAKLQAQGLEEEEIKEVMTIETKKLLDSVLENEGASLSPKAKAELAENLLDELTETAKQAEEAKGTKSLQNKFKKDIKSLLEKVLELEDAFDKKENQQQVEKLSTKLAELQIQGLDEEEIKEVMKKETKKVLDSMLENEGASLSPKAKDELTESLSDKLTETAKQAEEAKDTKSLQNEFKKDIKSLLKGVPELADAFDKKENQEQVEKLGKKLAELQAHELDEDKIKEVMKKETKKLLDTVLENEGASLSSKAKAELTENLLDKLTETAKQAKEAKDTKSLQNKFKKDIRSLLEEVPELEDAFDKKENQQQVEKFGKKLAELQAQGLDEEEIKEVMKKETKKLLDSVLENEGASLSLKSKAELTENLLDKITETAKQAKEAKDTKSLQNDFKKDIKSLLEGVPELVDAFDNKENQQQVEKFGKKLAELQAQGLDEEEIKEVMKKETKKLLDSVLENEGASLSLKSKAELTENLLHKITETAKQAKEAKDTKSLQNDFKKDIKSLLEGVPELVDAFDNKENQQQVEKLINKLAELQAQGLDEDELKEAMIKDTNKLLDSVLENEGASLSPKAKAKLTEKLLDKLTETAKQAEEAKGTKTLQNEFKKDIKNLLEGVPELENAFDKKEVEKLSTKLAELQSQGLDEGNIKEVMKKETKKLLDSVLENEGASLSPKAKAKLTENLLDQITETAKQAEEAKGTKFLQNKFKKDIKSLLEGVPELEKAFDKKENQQQVEKLSTKLADLKSQGLDEDEIKEVMKKETKKLLDSVLENEGASLSPKAKAKLTENLLDKLIKTTNQTEEAKGTESLQNKFKIDIKISLEGVPELANAFDNKENKQQLENLAKNLVDLQAQGLDEEEIKEVMEKETKKLLDSVLENEGASLSPHVRAKLTENLLDKLTETAKQAEEAKGTKTLQNEFKKDIKNLLEGVPELEDAFDKKENQQQVKKLAKKLAELQAQGLDEDEFKEVVQKETNKIFDSVLENEGASLSPNVKAKLTESLLDKLTETAKEAEKAKETKSLQNKFKKDIKSLLEGVPELENTFDKKENQQQVEKLGTKLAELQPQGFDEDKMKEVMKKETKKLIDSVLENESASLSPKTKAKLTENLLDKLTETAKQAEKAKETMSLQNKFKKDIKSLLEGVPVLENAFDKKENQQQVEKLGTKLAELQAQEFNEDKMKEVMKKETKKLLDSVLENESASLSPKAKAKLTENLLDKLTETAKQAEKAKGTKSLQNKFKKDIQSVLERVPELKDAFDKKENQQQVEKLGTKLAELQAQGFNEDKMKEVMKKETKKLLDKVLENEGASLSPKAKAKLTENLLVKLNETTKQAEEAKGTESLQNKFKIDMKILLEGVPELANSFDNKENQQQVEKLAKKLAELQAQGLDEEELNKVMKKETMKLLDSMLENEGASLSPNVKAKLTENLLEKLNETAKEAKEAKDTKSLQNKFKKDIKNLLEGVPELADAFDKKENLQQVEKLGTKLAELQAQGLDEDKIKEVMKKETKKVLDSMLENEGASLSPKAKAELTESLLDKLTETAKQAEEAKDTKSLQNEFKKDIKSLLEGVPELVDAFDTKENQQQVEKLAKKLAELQAQGLDEDELKEVMKKETNKLLDSVLENEGADLSPHVKAKLTDNLLDKLTETAKRAEEAKGTKSLQNEFKKDIKSLLEAVPELTDAFDKNENQQQVEKLGTKLGELQAQGLDEEEIKEVMKIETKKLVDSVLENEGASLSPKSKAELTENLLDKLTKTAKQAEEAKDTKSLQNKFKKDIKSLLEKVPELEDAFDKKENRQQVEKVSTKLAELQIQGLDEEEIKEVMKKDTNKLLNSVLENEGASLSPHVKAKLAEKLLDKLTETAKQAEEAKGTKSFQNEFKKDIKSLLEGVPELVDAFDTKENQQQVEKLVNKLAELQAQGLDEDELKEVMKKDTNKLLDSVLENEGASLSPNVKAKLTENLLDKLTETAKQAEEAKCIKSLQNKFKKDIKNLLEGVPELEDAFDKKENQQQVEKLAKKLANLQAQVLDEDEMKEVLKQETNKLLDSVLENEGASLSPNVKAKLTEKLLDKLTETAKQAEEAKGTKSLKNEFKKDIKSLLEGVPELADAFDKKENQQQVENLGKKLVELQAHDLDEDKIKEVMEKETKKLLDTVLENEGATLSPKAKAELTENLLEKLTETATQAKEAKGTKSLQKKLKKDIKSLLEGVPELEDAFDKKENQQQVEKLSTKLAELQAHDLDEDKIKEVMEKETKKLLDTVLENEGASLNPNVKAKLTEKLLDKLTETAKQAEEAKGSRSLQKEFKKDIKSLVEGVPGLSDAFDNKENQQQVEKLAMKLAELQAQGLDEDKIKEVMKKETKKVLDSMLENEGASLSPKAKAELTESLLDKLTETAKQAEGAGSLQNEIKQNVKKIFESVPELADAFDKKENQQQVEKLGKKLAELQAQGLDEAEIKEVMKKETKKLLDSVLENEGASFIPSAKAKLTEKLLDKLSDTVKNDAKKQQTKKEKHNLTLKNTLQNEFKQDIKDLFEEVPELADAFKKKENQRQVEKLAKKLAELQAQGLNGDEITEEMKDETKKLLDSILEKEGTDLSPKEKAKLTKRLMDKLTDTAKEFEGKSVSHEKVNEVDSIFEWLPDIPELDDDVSSTNANNKTQQVMAAKVAPQRKNVLGKEDLIQVIEEWFTENPKIPRDSKTNNKKMIDELANKLGKAMAGQDDEEMKKLAINVTIDWLDDLFAKNGKRAEPRMKNELASKLFNKLQSAAKRLSVYDSAGVIPGSIASAMEVGQFDAKYKENGRKRWSKQEQSEASSDVENSLINNNGTKSRGQVGTSHGGRESKSQSPNGRRGSTDKGRQSTSSQRTASKDMTNNNGTGIYFVEEVKDDNPPGRRKSILSESKTGSSKAASNTKRSISIILQEGMDKLHSPNSGDIKDEIVAILHNKGVPDRKAQAIADNIIEEAKARYPSEKEKVRLTSGEIKTILNDAGITNFREDIARSMADFLSSEIGRGKLDDHTRGSVHKILVEANVADKQADAATDALMNHAKRRSEQELSNRRQSSQSSRMSQQDNGMSAAGTQERPSLTPMEEQTFQENAEQEISDFVADAIGDDLSPREQRKVRRISEELAEHLKDFVADPNASPSEIRAAMEKKVREFLKQMPLNTDVPEDQLVNQLVNKLEDQLPPSSRRLSSDGRQSVGSRQGSADHGTDAEMVTSTPRRSSAKSFDPKLSSIRGANEHASMIKNNEQRYFEQLNGMIDQWINELPIAKDTIENKDVKESMVQDLSGDIIDRQKYLQLNSDAKTSSEDELENLKYQVFKCLNKMLDISDITPFLPYIADLMDKIRRIPVGSLVAPSSKLLQDEISKFIERVHPTMLTTPDKKYQQQMIKQLGDQLLIDINGPNKDQNIGNDIALWMANMFTGSQTELNKMGNELKRTLKRRGLLDNIQGGRAYKKPADILYDIIDKWCEDLPIYGGDSPEEQERIKTLKQNLSSKLINKVAELNLNPEVLNDDFLYEDLLIDEIDKLLDTVPLNPELEKYLPALKRDLISQIKEARHKIMNELAGQAYKQQLRDVVSTSIQFPICLSTEEQASFEILRENLVDAFVSLHYVECVCVNEEEVDKLKYKISCEINRFCNEYLRRHPRSPIDPIKLNQDLYYNLHKIPIPKDESMRSEVEKLRIKDVITKWVKSLTLKDETGWELVQRNKTISVLAKRLHEIEKEKESDPDFDKVGKMLEEIYKWLKKSPFKPGFEGEIPRAVEKLIELLRLTEESRKFNPSKSSFTAFSSDCCCPLRVVPPTPSCTLSLSDRLHLQMIRERVHARSTCTKDTCVSPPLPSFKDACIDPPAIDTGSQTDVRPWCPAAPGWNRPVCSNYPSWVAPLCPKMMQSSSVQTTLPTPTPNQTPYQMSPNIIVKEYGWDSNDSSQLQGSCQLQSPCHAISSPCKIQEEPPPCKPISPPKPKQIYSPKPSVCKCCNPQTCQKEDTRTSPETSAEECPAGASKPRRAETARSSRPCPNKRKRMTNETKTPSPGEESEWSSFRFPEDTDFWGSCSKTKRYICRKPMYFEPLTREREKREEKLRCKCKEKIKYSNGGVPCRSQRERSCDEALNRCSKCGGGHCPHPSYLYFR